MRRGDAVAVGGTIGPPTEGYDLISASFDSKAERALARADLRGSTRNQLILVRVLERTVEDLQKPDHPKNVAYLDGACRGPYLDMKRRIYSFDHHERCIRPFTLATAMQLLIMTRKRAIGATDGLTLIGKQPDLDTVFAAWAGIHADRMAFDEAVYRKIKPLFSVVNLRDSLGFGHEDLLDLPRDSIEEAQRKLLWIGNEERELKRRGRWDTTDFAEFVERTFQHIDEYALYKNAAEEVVQIDDHKEYSLSNGDTVIFARAPQGGVFGVERELVNKNSASKCVLVIFHDGKSKFTLKTTGIISRYDLVPVWVRASEEEMKAKRARGVTEEMILKTGWGGGHDIGGQPWYEFGMAPFISKDTLISLTLEELERQIAG